MRRGLWAWGVVAPTVVWAVIRVGGWDAWYPMAQLMAFTPYVTVGAAACIPISMWGRNIAAAIVAAVTTVVLVAGVLPRWMADNQPVEDGPRLRVLTANVLFGYADPAALVTLVRDMRVDVLALQELTPEFAAAADAAGLKDLLPYRALYAASGAEGSGVLSRLPLRDDGVRVNQGGFRQARAELVDQHVLIESAHPMAPYAKAVTPLWRNDFPGQPRATVDGPVRILLGDFNATLDHSLLRELIASGYRDAAAVTGQGLTGTWGPYDGDKIPPVVIDHVLADRRVGVASVQVLELPGSDHRPVFAELVLPTS